MKGIVKVAAVNCDDEKELAGAFGIKGKKNIENNEKQKPSRRQQYNYNVVPPVNVGCPPLCIFDSNGSIVSSVLYNNLYLLIILGFPTIKVFPSELVPTPDKKGFHKVPLGEQSTLSVRSSSSSY